MKAGLATHVWSVAELLAVAAQPNKMVGKMRRKLFIVALCAMWLLVWIALFWFSMDHTEHDPDNGLAIPDLATQS